MKSSGKLIPSILPIHSNEMKLNILYTSSIYFYMIQFVNPLQFSSSFFILHRSVQDTLSLALSIRPCLKMLWFVCWKVSWHLLRPPVGAPANQQSMPLSMLLEVMSSSSLSLSLSLNAKLFETIQSDSIRCDAK